MKPSWMLLYMLCFFPPRYPKERYLDGSDEDLTLNWPIFEDMTGFQNADHEKIRKLLDNIINGRIKDGAKLNTTLQNKFRYL